MDFKELKYMTAIAKYGNVSRAAESLGISQPSLSKYIHNLEDRYGVKFFQYADKTFRPTYAGNLYLQTAHKILQYAEKLEGDTLKAHICGQHKILRVYCPMLKSAYILPNIVPRFKQHFPNVTLMFNETTSNSAERLLLAEEVDIAITNFRPENENIQCEPLLSEEILLVVSKQNPLSNEGVWKQETGKMWIDIKKFRHESFIMPMPEQMIRRVVDELLRRENIEPNILMVTRSFEAAIRVAASGAGVAFAPELFVQSTMHVQAPMCFSVGDVKLGLDAMIAYKKGVELSPEAKYFVKAVKNFMG